MGNAGSAVMTEQNALFMSGIILTNWQTSQLVDITSVNSFTYDSSQNHGSIQFTFSNLNISIPSAPTPVNFAKLYFTDTTPAVLPHTVTFNFAYVLGVASPGDTIIPERFGAGVITTTGDVLLYFADMINNTPITVCGGVSW